MPEAAAGGRDRQFCPRLEGGLPTHSLRRHPLSPGAGSAAPPGRATGSELELQESFH